jgi:hypothetical protein
MPVAVPLTVTGNGPMVAVDEAVNVAVLVAPRGRLGLNVTVTPAGWPLADNVTAPVKPPVRVTVMVLPPDAPPCVTVTAFGLADSVKFGVCDGFTVSHHGGPRAADAGGRPADGHWKFPVAAPDDAVNVAVLVPPVADWG